MHIASMRVMANEASTPGERLRFLRKKAGYYRAEDLAKVVRVSTNTVLMHERNERNIPYRRAKAYARLLGTKPEFILEGKQFNQDYVNQPIIAPAALAPVRLPLLSCTDVEQFRSIASGAIPMSEQAVFASQQLLPGRRAFAVEMPDSSIDGRIAEEEHVFIDPDAEYKTGDIVAALAPGFVGLIIREYRVKSFDRDAKPVFELVALNEKFPSVPSDVAGDAQIIGRVIGAFRKF
jgi:SOS-response transcriptional repressor LexA